MKAGESNLLAVERRRIILEKLQQDSVVKNTDLAELLDVSVVTIRSDLKELESTGSCKVIRGGAILRHAPSTQPESDLYVRQKLRAAAKQRIGQYAAQLVEAGQTIIVDAGSTTVEMVRHFDRSAGPFRLVTPALNVALAATELDQVEVVLTGGVIRTPTLSSVGYSAVESLNQLNANYAFLASGGFSITHGVTTSHMADLEVKRAMCERASQIVLLADSTKYGHVHSLTVLPLEDVDIIVTDRDLSDADASHLINFGLEVVRV